MKIFGFKRKYLIFLDTLSYKSTQNTFYKFNNFKSSNVIFSKNRKDNLISTG